MSLPEGTMRVADSTIYGKENISKARYMLDNQSMARHQFNQAHGTTPYPEPPRLSADDYHNLNGMV